MTVHHLRPSKPPTLTVLVRDLVGWQDRIELIAAAHHAATHGDAGHPYDWRSCWDEPCWRLRQLAEQIGDEVGLSFLDDVE